MQTRDGVAIRAIEFTDENGARYGNKHVGNKMRTSSMPYTYDIAEGNVAGHTAIRRFGHNDDVAVAWETVYHGSNLRTYLTAAERLQVASDDAADDGPAGNGARTVTITGLDGNYAALSETVTMNGVANVLTDASFLRIMTVATTTAGDTGWNEGTITASNNADTVVLEEIPPVENESHCACYTVPAGYTAYIVQAMATEASTKGSQLGLWLRLYDGLWTMKRTTVIFDSSIVLPMPMTMVLPQMADIEIRAHGVLAGANVTAGFEGWIEAN